MTCRKQPGAASDRDGGARRRRRDCAAACGKARVRDARIDARRDQKGCRRGSGQQGQGEDRRAPADRERQCGPAHDFLRESDDGGRSRQGNSRIRREESAAERRERSTRSALRAGDGVDSHPPRGFAEGHRHCANERRLVLVQRGRSHRHACRLSRGSLTMARALINAPAKAKRGEIIEIKTLISHNMETGFRPDNTGKPVPRDIITDFICKYNGQEIFRAELFPAIAANPFLTFSTIATESGTLSFEWTGDNGFTATESVNITVE